MSWLLDVLFAAIFFGVPLWAIATSWNQPDESGWLDDEG